MRKDRERALKLRLHGRSYAEIRSVLGVPKSTLSGWFSQVILSPSLQKRLLARTQEKSIAGLIARNKRQTEIALHRVRAIRENAARQINRISKQELFMIGIALYWAEGYKRPIVRNGREVTSHIISLTNSDPWLVKTFLRFLRECLEVPEIKIKGALRIFKHQNESELLLFWQQVTKIPPSRFLKTYRGISKSSLGKRPFNQLPHGIIQITVNSTQLFHTIMGSIEGFKKLV